MCFTKKGQATHNNEQLVTTTRKIVTTNCIAASYTKIIINEEFLFTDYIFTNNTRDALDSYLQIMQVFNVFTGTTQAKLNHSSARQ